LAISKRIRSKLQLQKSTSSIEHSILHAGRLALQDFKKSSILFVGASSINQKLLPFFNTHGIGRHISLCNRSDKSAQEFATKYGVNLLPWENLSNWHRFDWVICGTKSTEHLITQKTLPTKIRAPKLLIDLGVPRNVDPVMEKNDKIILWNIDQLSSVSAGKAEKEQFFIHQADEIVNNSTERYIDLFRLKEERALAVL